MDLKEKKMNIELESYPAADNPEMEEKKEQNRSLDQKDE